MRTGPTHCSAVCEGLSARVVQQVCIRQRVQQVVAQTDQSAVPANPALCRRVALLQASWGAAAKGAPLKPLLQSSAAGPVLLLQMVFRFTDCDTGGA
jgi:hypothetical protein